MKNSIRRYTSEELDKLHKEGKSQTDFKRLKEMTEQQLEDSIKDDPDWKGIPGDWYDDPRTAIQDGLLIAFNEPRNNDWITEHEVVTKVFDFRDLLKRVFWKRI